MRGIIAFISHIEQAEELQNSSSTKLFFYG